MKSGTMKIIPHTVDMKTVRPLYGPHNGTVSTPKKSPPAKKRKYQKRKRVKSGKKLLPITRNRIEKNKKIHRDTSSKNPSSTERKKLRKSLRKTLFNTSDNPN